MPPRYDVESLSELIAEHAELTRDLKRKEQAFEASYTTEAMQAIREMMLRAKEETPKQEAPRAPQKRRRSRPAPQSALAILYA